MLLTPIPLPPEEAERMTRGSYSWPARPARPQVVILGGGFGGLAAARALARSEADVIVVDRHHSQTLQPLLPLVAAGRLPLGVATTPIAAVLGRQANARFVRGEVHGIDKVQRTVQVGDRDLPYDFLIVATGARPAAPAGIEPMLALTRAADAVAVRERVRRALTRAERTDDAAERQRLTTFVIAGAGPTGVALAGAIARLARRAVASEFRGLDPESVKVVLVETEIRVLPGMQKGLSGIARRALQEQRVELRLGVSVDRCDANGVVVAGKRLPSATVLWAGGVACPAARWLEAPSDDDGRVLVESDLTLPGHPDIFVVGDAARVVQDGQPLAGLAAVARREGGYAALAIAARIAGKPAPAPFRARPARMLAPIGGAFAIGRFGPVPVWGRLGWLAWAAFHLPSLIGIGRGAVAMFGVLRERAMPPLGPIAGGARARTAET
jgi:NADH dehydrogenase